MAEGFTGEVMKEVAASFQAALLARWTQGERGAALVVVAARAGQSAALAEAVAKLRGGALPEVERRWLLDLIAAARPAAALDWLCEQTLKEKNEARRTALLATFRGLSGSRGGRFSTKDLSHPDSAAAGHGSASCCARSRRAR
jgi:hypothetical protein